MKHRVISQFVVCPWIVLACVGCGFGPSDPYQRQPVSGTVSFDGQPITKGAITFFPDGAGSVASGAQIIDGKYEISKKEGLPAGNYKVSISAPETIPTKNPLEFPTYRETIPKQYNQETKLFCDIKVDSENVIPFELNSSKN